eukprot:6389891-Pyramimonas_sp.AAC.1
MATESCCCSSSFHGPQTSRTASQYMLPSKHITTEVQGSTCVPTSHQRALVVFTLHHHHGSFDDRADFCK